MKGDGSLRCLRVLDSTRVLSGPFTTALFVEVGAAVVKVEAPRGDEYCHIGPFRAEKSALFAECAAGGGRR
jgi:CoA:oxalate CoA-transferase